MEQFAVIIVGAGPAGLSGAIYTARGTAATLVLGGKPKIAGPYPIDNYFGFAETVMGEELLRHGTAQAERFGAVIKNEIVLTAYYDGESGFAVTTKGGQYHATALLLAPGVALNRPNVPRLSEYEGKGVSYCVSCDGFFFRQKPVAVLGEGDYAAHQALELLAYTPSVTLCTNGKQITVSQEFQSKLKEAGIPVIEAPVKALEGAPHLTRIAFKDHAELEAEGLFIALGEASALDFARSLGLEIEKSHIVVTPDQHTNIPGVFAAGDCTGAFPQIAVAVGDGAKAGRAALQYIKSRGGQ